MRRALGFLGAALLAATVSAQSGPASARPPTASGERWWANAVFYQVFVRSFQDSNGDGNGDFKGLASRLPYLQDLGVNALWLMPIHPSPSYHGYDVTDYKAVNPQYGSLADFDAFLKAAHERGMRVIIDWVPNHTSLEHPWFAAARNPSSDKRDWYVWRKDNPGWNRPWGEASPVWFPVASGSAGTRVVFAGTLQAALGGSAWDPNGNVTAATEASPGVWELVARLPKGRYEYKVALGGSWGENYGAGDKADGPNIALTVPADNTVVKLVFDRNRKTVRDSINNPSVVKAPASAPARAAPANAASTSYYYAAFWEGMPDLNWRNPAVEAAMNDAARFWLQRGVDGFRVDAMRYILEKPASNAPDNDENLEWPRRFARFVKSVKPEAALVGEVWTDTSTVGRYFLGGAGLDMAFNFDLREGIKTDVGNGRPGRAVLALEETARSYPPAAVDATFTTNHDLVRPSYPSPDRYRVAADLLLTLPGTPFLYYGEEIAIPNGLGGDEAKRTPMRWTADATGGFTTGKPWRAYSTTEAGASVAEQLARPGSLLNHYRNLIKLRQSRPALRSGGYFPLEAGERALAFVRYRGDERLLVVSNLADQPARVTVNLKGSPLEAARGPVRELTLGKSLPPITDANASSYSLGTMAPGGLVVLEVGSR